MIESLWLPPGYRYRELWLPQNIIPNTSLLRSVHNGHDLTLTGALLGSTVDGLKMRGAERITITDHADIHIADNLTVVLPAFILTGTFPDDYAADMGLMNLNNGAVIARLNQATGALDFIFNDVDGGADLTVSTTKVSWAAGIVWQVAFTFVNNGTGVISVRLYINGVAENTNDQVDQVITVPAGNTVLGEDLTTFFTGKFQRMFLVYDTAVLTEAQLLQVYRGVPYTTNLKAYIPLDHPGRGLTMPDRSTGGNCSGTISGTVIGAEIWDFGQVKQPVISTDGINDVALSSAAVNISGDITAVIVIKVKETYSAPVTARYLNYYYIDANNNLSILAHTTDQLRFRVVVGGAGVNTDIAVDWEIGSYKIILGTVTIGGILTLYENGSFLDSVSGAGVLPTDGAIANIGRNGAVVFFYGNTKPLLVALIDGAFNQQQTRAYSRYLKNIFNLPIAI